MQTNKPVIISTGGKNLSDIDKLYNFFSHKGCKFAFLHCVAEYPAPFEQLQLDFIDRLNKRYPEVTIGYSGHEDPSDNTVPMLAVAKGAKILERHVGLSTETISLNAYSMNPQQADKWVAAALKAKTICTTKKDNNKYISQEELDSLHSLMRGVFSKRKIEKGEKIYRGDVFFAMPCNEKQMSSGDFYDGIIARKSYNSNEEIHEKKKFTDINLVRNVIHDAKGMLYEAGIALGSDFEVELSHHYGM